MRGLFTTFLDLLFPPSEEALIVRGLSTDSVQNLMSVTSLPHGYALTRFSDPRVRALIHEAKFAHNRNAFVLLNILFLAFLERERLWFDVIVPVPLSARRLRERGHNQVRSVLEAGPPLLTNIIHASVLVRNTHTRPQTDLSRDDRLVNVRNVFTVAEPGAVAGKRVLLVDDVATTGATLASAREALLTAHPASVDCIALAH